MGSLYKRGKTWWIKVYRPGIGPHRFSTETQDRKAAQAMLRIIDGDMARGLIGAAPGTARFSRLAQLVLDDYKLNGKKTCRDVEARLRLHILPVLENVKAVQINPAMLRSYAANRQKEGAANGTINREFAVIRRAMTLGWESNLIPQVPKFPMLTEAPPRQGFFGDWDLEALCRHLRPYLVPFVRFGYLTGWRTSEISGLEWRSVDWEREEIRLGAGETKNGHPRTFPIGPGLREIFEERRAATDELATTGELISRVFWYEHRRKICPVGDFRANWNTACQKAGLPGRIFHDLRRSAVRNMVRNGIPERVAMSLCGHLTRAVFDRYNIVSTGDLELARTRIGHRSGHNAEAPSPEHYGIKGV